MLRTGRLQDGWRIGGFGFRRERAVAASALPFQQEASMQPSGGNKGLRQVTRRGFLRSTGLALATAGAAPVLSAPFVSSALAQSNTLTIVQWSHFVPAFDKWFDNFAQEWGKKNKVSVTVDHIPEQNIAARAAAEASAKSGHDLFMWNGAGGAHLYRKFLVNMTSLVEELEKKYGEVSVLGRQIAFNEDDKTWSAFPDYYINLPGMYRKDLWDEIGMKPETWD